MSDDKDKNIILFSFPLLVLVCIAAFFGVFFSEHIYSREVIEYAVQGIGQDLVTLFIVVPVFTVSMLYAYKKNIIGILLWGGSLFYFAYTYLVYSFGLHFNQLFLVYCAILGVSFYGFLYFLIFYKETINIKMKLRLTISVYLLLIASLFYLIWLQDILPSIIMNTIPRTVAEYNIITNPIYVVDIALCLPFLIIIAILIIRERSLGYFLAPAALLFTFLLSLAVIGMIIAMAIKGIPIDLGLIIIFACISLASFILLIVSLKNYDVITEQTTKKLYT
ncbi:MAG: hypothetical protein ACM34N_11480 [Ignavibacteria bacterium]